MEAKDNLPNISGLASVWPENEDQSPATVYFQPPRRKSYPAKWLVIWQDVSEIGVSIMEQAKSERPLTQTEYRVRDWLLGMIGIGNYVYVNQSQMARELRIPRPNASEAIKSLIERGILLRGPKSGRSNTYAVSPAFCFFGNLGSGVKERQQAIKDGKARVLQFKQSEK